MKVKSDGGRERTESMKLTDKAESIERVRRRFRETAIFRFFHLRSTENPRLTTNHTHIQTARAIALAPGKNLFMTGFMLWMSGSTVHIFSMMFTMMAMKGPLTALFSINKAFKSIDDGTLNLMKWKLAFVGVNLLGLAMALYKCNSLGLLPLSSSDWVHLLPIKESEEWSGGGAPL